MIGSAIKVLVIVVLTLVFSQVQIGSRRVCEHFHVAALDERLQKPIRWITKKVDFTSLEKKKPALDIAVAEDFEAADPEVNSGSGDEAYFEREQVSAVLKPKK
jgi:hypothetical protein